MIHNSLIFSPTKCFYINNTEFARFQNLFVTVTVSAVASVIFRDACRPY